MYAVAWFPLPCNQSAFNVKEEGLHVATIDGIDVYAKTSCPAASASFFDKISQAMDKGFNCVVEFKAIDNKVYGGEQWLPMIVNTKKLTEGTCLSVKAYTKKSLSKTDELKDRSRSPRSTKPKAAAAKPAAAKTKPKAK